MKKQSMKSKMDEHLGMKDGKESKKKQSMKARRDESMGMKHSKEEMKKAYCHMKKHGG